MFLSNDPGLKAQQRGCWHSRVLSGARRKFIGLGALALVQAGSLLVMSGTAGLAQTWTDAGLPSTEYMSVGVSADGSTILAGTFEGPIHASTNAGITWTSISPPSAPPPSWPTPYYPAWIGVACSADGRTITAAGNGLLCVSTNAGVSWTSSSMYEGYHSVACSADGKKLVAVADHSWNTNSSGIYLSDDYGVNWTEAAAPALLWYSVACSANRSTIVAGPLLSQPVYVSTNSGVTWKKTSLPGAGYASVACSADGRRMIVGADAVPGVFISTNSGATWTSAGLPTNGEWWSVCCSADGTKLVAADHAGPIFLSADSGASWTNADAPLTNWYVIAASADANTLVGASMNADYLGLVYTARSVPTPRLALTPAESSLVLSWALPSRKFVLQQTSDLASSNWTDVTTAPVLNYSSLVNQVAVPTPRGDSFYRLISR